MPYFVIAGKPDCPQYAHVVYVAKYLERHLPNFKIHTIQKKTGAWERWLRDINEKSDWNHLTSPLIYKELVFQGGTPHLIGGISSFWEYCFDYYGLESYLPQEDLQKMVEDNMQYFKDREEAEAKAHKNARHITIIGVSNPLLTILLPQLYVLISGAEIKIKLYDRDIYDDGVLEFVEGVVADVSDMASNIEIVQSLREAFQNTELVIIIDDLSRKKEEDMHKWYTRNRVYIYQLSDYINKYSSKFTRIVLAHEGPVCFNATLLVDVCTTIRISNIVCVTSDLGLGALATISKEADIPVSELGAPPVWGCIGVNEFVDVRTIIKKCKVYRPNSRAIKITGNSTLPLGTVKTELRYLNYVTDGINNLWEQVYERRKIIQKTYHHQPIFAKVRAIMSLLKLWYAKEESDNIISLGVICNGAFGLSNGIVFSQPVMLENKIWTPFKNFPISNETKKKITAMHEEVEDFLEQFLLERRTKSRFYI